MRWTKSESVAQAAPVPAAAWLVLATRARKAPASARPRDRGFARERQTLPLPEGQGQKHDERRQEKGPDQPALAPGRLEDEVEAIEAAEVAGAQEDLGPASSPQSKRREKGREERPAPDRRSRVAGRCHPEGEDDRADEQAADEEEEPLG